MHHNEKGLTVSSNIWIRYSNQTRDQNYIKGYNFLSFLKTFSDTFGKKLMDTTTKNVKNLAIDAAKAVSKRDIQKALEVASDLFDNEVADKISSVGKPKKNTVGPQQNNEIQEIYIPSEKCQQVMDDLRLI